LPSTFSGSKPTKSQSSKFNEDKNDREINDLEEGINIYNENKKIRNQGSSSKMNEIYYPKDFKKIFNKNLRIRLNRKIKFSKNEDDEENYKYRNQSTRRNVINRYKIQPVKSRTSSFKESKDIELKEMQRIPFNYNILEILWSYIGTFCMTNKLKSKINLTRKSNIILNDKLDISLYIKNTILIDILNQALINDNMKSMTKFISRPIISLRKSGERDMSQFYKNYEITDFDNLYEDVSQMSKKHRLTQAEQKIISLVFNELNEMV
jgi:hypothetical protein